MSLQKYEMMYVLKNALGQVAMTNMVNRSQNRIIFLKENYLLVRSNVQSGNTGF